MHVGGCCVVFCFTSMLYAEMRLAGARRTKGEDASEDDIPSTSGRQFMEAAADGGLDVPKV